jgi:hypothetical protein
MRSPEFAATYAAITKRRGKKIATIAIARKLLTPRLPPARRRPGRRPGTICQCGMPAHRSRGVTKPRVRSPQRHEPATGRARSFD